MSAHRVLRYRLNTRLGRLPWLVYPLYALTGRHRDFVVARDTELVIEGFPRSGATFCWYAFLHAQERPCKVATHVHVPAQVIRAVRRGIPAVVLVRRPADAVRSAMLREPDIPAAAFLDRYLAFYGCLETYKERVVVADFEDAVADVGALIEAANARHGTRFRRFVHSDESLAAVNAGLDERHRRIGGAPFAGYRPSPAKDLAKRRIDLSAEAARLAACQVLYERFSPRGGSKSGRQHRDGGRNRIER